MPRPTRFLQLALLDALVNGWSGPLQFHSPQPGHFLAGPQLQQAVDGRLDQVDRVGAAVHLGQDVADAARLRAPRGRRGRP